MLSQASKDIIAATLPAVKACATDITGVFYPLMFERYPEVKAFFNQTHQAQGTQRQALANAVVAYAANLDRLEVLGDAVSLIVQKHVSLGIQPEHYPIVGECLLAAIREVLGEAATDAVLGAWGEAYGQLAELLIGAEEAQYAGNAAREGGWRGERAFKVVRRERESEVIESFYLQPADAGALADFQPGQYIGLVLEIDGQQVRRNYSLSCAPGLGYYRISVKREPGGLVSSYLHERVQVGDELLLSAPAGDFVLNDAERPLVLLSGGVGITPTLSMLRPALENGRAVHFLHGALNSRHQAFGADVAALQQDFPALQLQVLYSEPLAEDAGQPQGLFDQAKLAALLPAERDLDVYLLGPRAFMQSCYASLRALGVAAERIRYEFFGPLEAIEG